MALDTLTFEWMKDYDKDIMTCVENGMTMLIIGDDGCGKVNLLERQLTKFQGSTKQPGRAHLHRLTREAETIRHIRDIADGICDYDRRMDWRMYSLSQTIDYLVATLREKDIRLLMLAKAQHVGREFFEALNEVLDRSREEGHLMGAVVSGRGQVDQFLDATGGASGAVLGVRLVRRLDAGECLSALHQWCRGIDSLVERVQTGEDDEANEMAEKIRNKCHGNFAQLAKLAVWKNVHKPSGELTPKLLDSILQNFDPAYLLSMAVRNR